MLTRVVYTGVGKNVLFIEVSSTQRCGVHISTQVYQGHTHTQRNPKSVMCVETCIYCIRKECSVCGPGAARSSQRGL